MVARVMAVVLLVCGGALGAFKQDFEATAVGELPEGIQLLHQGECVVREVAGSKALEFPGTPIDACGALVGPGGITLGTISARVHSTATGKRFNEFGVGLGDAAGYRVVLMPGQKKMQLQLGEEEVLAAGALEGWKSDAWTRVKLRVRAAGEKKWRVEAKAWADGAAEPAEWACGVDVDAAPPTGRASLWAIPFAETAICFDDVVIE